MASVYKLKRKDKKIPPKADPKNNEEILDRLLFGENAEPSQEKNAEAETLTEKKEELKEKKEEKKEKRNIEEEESLFTAADDKTAIPQDLLDALSSTKVDSDKMEEVFSRSKGTVGSDSSAEEYDETTDLLREIFGTAHTPKRNKKKFEAVHVPTESADDTKPFESTEVFGAKEEAETEYVADHSSDDDKTRDYIAIHDGDEEKTKEYGSLAEANVPEIDPAEMTRTDIPPLTDEFHVSDESSSDDPYNDTYEELETKYERRSVLPDEFTSPEEYDEFAEHLRNKNYKSLSSLLWTFLAFLAVLYLESATFSAIPHPEILTPGGIYNTIYLLVDLLVVLYSGLFVLSSLIRGVKNLFSGRPDRNTVLFVLYFFAALHAVVLLVTGVTEYPLFGSVAALFAMLNSIANFLDAKRTYRTFRICGSRREKLVAKALGQESPEAEAFREELDGTPSFFSIQKADFIENFFERSDKRSKVERSYAWVLALSLVFSIAFAVFTYLKSGEIAETATNFVMMSVMTLPLSCVFSISLPFAHVAAKSEKLGSTIVSVAAAEEYASADVVSFTDKEIFPPKSVKITTIRTYGQTRIDKAILNAAMIFQKLGGPLSEVFKKTISGVVDEISEDFDFKEITADGMCASIDGKDVFVGNKNYLLSYDFGYTRDDQDEAFEEKHGKIMYMVIGSELAAKFYIRYAISKQFKKTVLTLFRSGICPAVKTCDPNIDSDLFRTLLQNKKIPAGIIKSCEAMKDAPSAEKSDSGVVCISSIARLLRTFSLCDSLRHLTRANVVMKILSLVLGAGIVAFLFFISGLSRVTGLFVLIYQLLWLIPIVIPSLTE